MKTILVTGATGNQGGAVAASLIKKGFKIIWVRINIIHYKFILIIYLINIKLSLEV